MLHASLVALQHPVRTLSIFACSMALLSCSKSPEPLLLSGPTMGTTYSVKVVGPPAEITPDVLRTAIDAELERIDRAMSGYREDSEISRFNAHRSTDWFAVSDELARVVQASLEVSERSGGAFDVTVAPLVRAWGFGAGAEQVDSPPTPEVLSAVSERIGYRKLHVRMQPPALRKDVPALEVDLNAIAPGFAVDRIAQRFDGLGLAHYMIELGGEVRVRGHRAPGQPWRIAVERPEVSAETSVRTPWAILNLSDIAVTTSGQYRNYYARQGRRYSHTLDPRTLAPVTHALEAVVVLHREAMYADAWATAFNVLGPNEGYALAGRLGMKALFIERDGEELVGTMTEGFGEYVD